MQMRVLAHLGSKTVIMEEDPKCAKTLILHTVLLLMCQKQYPEFITGDKGTSVPNAS